MRKQINVPLELRSQEAHAVIKFRADNNWTQREMSNITGIGLKTISQIELGSFSKKPSISREVIMRLNQFGLNLNKIEYGIKLATRGRIPKLKDSTANYLVKSEPSGGVLECDKVLTSSAYSKVNFQIKEAKLPEHTKFISDLLLEFDKMVSEQIKTCEREMDKLSNLESIQRSIRETIKNSAAK